MVGLLNAVEYEINHCDISGIPIPATRSQTNVGGLRKHVFRGCPADDLKRPEPKARRQPAIRLLWEPQTGDKVQGCVGQLTAARILAGTIQLKNLQPQINTDLPRRAQARRVDTDIPMFPPFIFLPSP
jgi:hypothetical protein